MEQEIYVRAFYKWADNPREYRLMNNLEVSFKDIELPYTVNGKFYCRVDRPTEIKKYLPELMLFPAGENNIHDYNECYMKAICNKANLIKDEENGGADAYGEITIIEELKL